MEKKPKGRPPRSNTGRPSINLTMRLRPENYEELRRSAEHEGRSISAQAERRLIQPSVHEIAHMVSLAIEGVELRTGQNWRQSAETREVIRESCDAILNIMLGPTKAGSLEVEKEIREDIDAIQNLAAEQLSQISHGDIQKMLERSRQSQGVIRLEIEPYSEKVAK